MASETKADTAQQTPSDKIHEDLTTLINWTRDRGLDDARSNLESPLAAVKSYKDEEGKMRALSHGALCIRPMISSCYKIANHIKNNKLSEESRDEIAAIKRLHQWAHGKDPKNPTIISLGKFLEEHFGNGISFQQNLFEKHDGPPSSRPSRPR